MTFTHGSLFAGIGGFDLGFERAGFKTVWQVEIDPFCRRILERHFPDAERFTDVRECRQLPAVDVITGGFPCQDVSAANATGKGLDGDRSGLWFEYLRLIGELRPPIAVMENVTNLFNRGIGRVLGGLAEIGYDAEWQVIPASAFGAPHRRERIWIVAYSNSPGTRIFSDKSRLSEVRCPQLWQSFRAVDLQAWLETYCGLSRNDDGLSGHVDESQALGNAVMPQIAEFIAHRIKDVLESEPGIAP